MIKRNAEPSALTIGLDLGDRISHVCVLSEQGEVVERTRFPTRMEAFRDWFGSQPQATRVVLEAGGQSRWIAELLEELGHEVVVANPRKLRLIYENANKNDRADAEYLARVGRMDPTLLAPIRHRGHQAHADLTLLRSREVLVRSRTQLVNHIRSVAKSFGFRMPACSTRVFARRSRIALPSPVYRLVEPLIETLDALSEQIRTYDQRIAALDATYPEIPHLRQVHGVGPLTASTFVLTIEDPRRFPQSRIVGAYLGLCPRRDQSGNRDPELRITKCGDPFLRRLLVSAAQFILGPFGRDSDLRRKGLLLAARGGKAAKKRAVVAVARRLAVLLHHLWMTGAVYEPLRSERA